LHGSTEFYLLPLRTQKHLCLQKFAIKKNCHTLNQQYLKTKNPTAMKNPNQTFHKEESHAKKAAQQIQSWIEKKYPRLANSAKTKMIIECLIELSEEKKFLAAHR
jgi:hypothetical protein